LEITMPSKSPSFCSFPSLASVAALAWLAGAPTVKAQADHCSGATPIVANHVYTGSNNAATSDIAQSSCSQADSYDVWYAFTATAAGDYSIDTLYSALDTTLVVYGSCGGAELACNDDVDPGFDTTSLIVITLNAGQSIRIRVAGYAFDRGSFELFITPPSVQPATGACCQGATCTVLAQTDCAAAGTSFVGADTACNALGNNSTPCCKADYNHIGGISVQDIFDFLNDWLAGNPRADINGGGLAVQDIFDFINAWLAGCS
jgi:hypothetical protein